MLAARRNPRLGQRAPHTAIASRRALKAHRAKAQALIAEAWRIEVAALAITEEEQRVKSERPCEAITRQRILPMGLADLLAGHAAEILPEAGQRAMWSFDEAYALRGVCAARASLRRRLLAQIGFPRPWLSTECAKRFRLEQGSRSAMASRGPRLRKGAPPVQTKVCTILYARRSASA